jgi:hypothetical protein
MNEPTPRRNDDAEAAALDEAWSALTHLLDASPSTFDEDRLVWQVCSRLARRRAKRRWFATLAVAAVVVLSVSVAWWPRLAAQRQVARAPQSAIPADFGWYDELADEIESATWTFESVKNQTRGEFDRARWVQQEMDELESEMELSSL